MIAKEAPLKVFNKYINFANKFFLNLASELPEHIGINNHAIELVDGQQPTYEPIYSLELVELKTSKSYIETNQANEFISPSKSLSSTFILFDQKLDGAL